jgi:putative hydrolase of the HAD superfamily
VSLAVKLIEHFKTDECWTVTPGSVKLLERLKNNNVKLGVISNFDPRLRDLLRLFDLYQYFDVIVLSHEVQLSKPDKAIFDIALKQSALPKTDCNSSSLLHIGDNEKLDYVGAISAGWSARLIVDPSKVMDAPLKSCVKDISDLEMKLFQ